MRALSFIIGGWLLACVGMGCASAPAPPPLCPDPYQVQESAFGAWIELQTHSETIQSARPVQSPAPAGVRGELVAIEPDSVYVLTPSRLVAVSKTEVTSARLYTFSANIGALALWTVLGALSTASHGAGLVLSLPVWIIAGTATAISESHAPEVRLPGKSWESLRVFARFPGGLPPGLDRTALIYPLSSGGTSKHPVR